MKALAFGFVSLSSAVVLVACSKSTCPYPGTSAVTITPGQSCLAMELSSCVHPTLAITNNCADDPQHTLYLPTDYALDNGAGAGGEAGTAGVEIEVLGNGRRYTFEVRDDKATSHTSTHEDYAIPARLGAQPITITFSTSSE